MIKIVELLAKSGIRSRNGVSEDYLRRIEELTGVKLTSKVRRLVCDLSSLDSEDIVNSDKSILCNPESSEVDSSSLLNKPSVIGVVNQELASGDESRYMEFMKSMDSMNVPLILFDSFMDGSHNIGIDKKGRVVEVLQESVTHSILAKDQDSFIKKLYVR